MPATLRRTLAATAILLAWAASGVTMVPSSQREVAGLLGMPVRVLHPGLHAGLPWPIGSVRRVENGQVHETVVNLSSMAAPAAAGPPAPGGHAGIQPFAARLHIYTRTGLTDADALHAAYATRAPGGLVRVVASRALTALAASQISAAGSLREQIQQDLDRLDTGLEVTGIAIDGPRLQEPLLAASDRTRAAAIAAEAEIARAHGEAASATGRAHQAADTIATEARANAAEIVAGARTGLVGFRSDQQAVLAGRASFLFERYLTALETGLAGKPKTIIDHRLNWPEAPVLDLRPLAAASSTGTGKEE